MSDLLFSSTESSRITPSRKRKREEEESDGETNPAPCCQFNLLQPGPSTSTEVEMPRSKRHREAEESEDDLDYMPTFCFTTSATVVNLSDVDLRDFHQPSTSTGINTITTRKRKCLEDTDDEDSDESAFDVKVGSPALKKRKFKFLYDSDDSDDEEDNPIIPPTRPVHPLDLIVIPSSASSASSTTSSAFPSPSPSAVSVGASDSGWSLPDAALTPARVPSQPLVYDVHIKLHFKV